MRTFGERRWRWHRWELYMAGKGRGTSGGREVQVVGSANAAGRTALWWRIDELGTKCLGRQLLLFWRGSLSTTAPPCITIQISRRASSMEPVLPTCTLSRAQNAQRTLRRQRDQRLALRSPASRAGCNCFSKRLRPALGRLGVVLDGNAARARRCEELARVVPLNALHRVADVERLDACRLAQVPNLNARLPLRNGREPGAVFGKGNGLNRSAGIKVGHFVASLGVKDFDFAVLSASRKKVAVGVEAAAQQFWAC